MHSNSPIRRRGTMHKGKSLIMDPGFNDNIFLHQAQVKLMQQDVYSEKPRGNLYNVIKKLRENSNGWKHTLLVCKLKDDSGKQMYEENVRQFYDELGDEFLHKVTGYCLIYGSFCIHLIECDDEEYNDFLLKHIHDSIGTRTHEQVWMLFQTEEVPTQSFHQWYCRAYEANKAEKELKTLKTMYEKVDDIYSSMLLVGDEVRKVLEKGKGESAVESVLRTQSLGNLPAQEDLNSALDKEQQTLTEYMEFNEPPDILLEKELCWPVEPDLDY